MPHTCKHIYFQVETGSERGDCAGCVSETETSRIAVGDAYPDIGYTFVGVIETQRLKSQLLKKKSGREGGWRLWGPCAAAWALEGCGWRKRLQLGLAGCRTR